MPKTRSVVSKIAALYIVALIFFVWGIAAATTKIFPWKYVAPIYAELYTVLTFTGVADKSTLDKVILGPLERRVAHDVKGFFVHDPDFDDNGYLLISRYNKEMGESTVELFSIADQAIIHEWPLPRAEILDRARDMKFTRGNPLDRRSFRALHPLLLDDGGLVFNAGLPSPLARIDACGDIVWTINRNFHHSIELDHNGNIVSPIVLEGQGPTALPIRDDGYAVVSPEGEILEEYSITGMLLDNGYRGLIYGIGTFARDRIHLNDAQPVMFATEDAKVGDVLLSALSLSAVALFQPDTGKLKWVQVGPWLNQHDISQLADGTYSIFGNDTVGRRGDFPMFVEAEKSDVYIYDAVNDRIEQPYSQLMGERKISTLSSGRTRILPNGDAFIEATDNGKLYRIFPEGMRWEYVNSTSDETIGLVSWSRYFTREELDLSWKDGLSCD